ncbi:Hsp33 family molecular chaperone HslO [Cytobacillus firmus]|uniref:Hsp33 family molecular chaperone HslO n=1 Tax=Chungangia koreensis TaxID=752657 RepID=A0ABV8X0S6_9LACT|nr:Hsp33 family molecular chaperone HslO [Cytobacillus firmus]MCM3707549.1 Hsp33 family molecular chaperone HslO [Cytobacillus firmus]
MRDKVIRALILDKQVRLFISDNTALINEIVSLNEQNHRILNVALGKIVSGISLLSATLKGEQRLSATFTLGNSKYKIYADADSNGNIRGYNSRNSLKAETLEGISIKELIGQKGTIRMIKGFNMSQFTGITDMPYQNIDDDLSHYFKQSEQLETLIETNLDFGKDNTVSHSYGMFAQLLPGASKHLLKEVKEKINTNSNIFKNLKVMEDIQIEQQLKSYFSDSLIIGLNGIKFSCGCSKEMFYGLLYSIERKDLLEYIHDNKSIESSCHICGRSYIFSPSELKLLL